MSSPPNATEGNTPVPIDTPGTALLRAFREKGLVLSDRLDMSSFATLQRGAAGNRLVPLADEHKPSASEILFCMVGEISPVDSWLTPDGNWRPSSKFGDKSFLSAKIRFNLTPTSNPHYADFAPDWTTIRDNLCDLQEFTMAGHKQPPSILLPCNDEKQAPFIAITHALLQKIEPLPISDSDSDNDGNVGDHVTLGGANDEANDGSVSVADSATLTDTSTTLADTSTSSSLDVRDEQPEEDLRALLSQYHIDNWPASDEFTSRLERLSDTHVLNPLPAFRKRHNGPFKLIKPDEYVRRLVGAVVLVTFSFVNYAYSQRSTCMLHLTELHVLESPTVLSAPSSPVKKRVAVASSSAESSKKTREE